MPCRFFGIIANNFPSVKTGWNQRKHAALSWLEGVIGYQQAHPGAGSGFTQSQNRRKSVRRTIFQKYCHEMLSIWLSSYYFLFSEVVIHRQMLYVLVRTFAYNTLSKEKHKISPCFNFLISNWIIWQSDLLLTGSISIHMSTITLEMAKLPIVEMNIFLKTSNDDKSIGEEQHIRSSACMHPCTSYNALYVLPYTEKGNVVILMKFPSLATLNAIKMKTFNAASDKNFVKMTLSVSVHCSETSWT